ncbi:MAG TPA: GH3 auxin-responsive promoter family protein [Tissierellia bacterium]|nr:GH3 auxin-responsive promoter family protein [Tissierellia bacterium]
MKLLYRLMRAKYRSSALAYLRAPAEEKRLLALIRANESSRYGRRYDFHRIHSVADFQRLVPIVGYDDISPWVEQIRQGESKVLTAQPVRLLEPTGGSSGRHKWIPYTKELQDQFRRSIEAWLYDIYTSYPGVAGGRSYWLITPPLTNDDAESAVRLGFEDDSAYLGSLGSRVMSQLMVQSRLTPLMSTLDFYRETLRALLEAADLRLISVWNPSLLLGLLAELAKDPEAVLKLVSPRRRQAIRRAVYRGDLTAVWPQLRLISAWADGSAKMSAEALRERFPEVHFQPKGLLSTEAIVSFPTRESLAHGGMLPAYHSTFLEFRQAQAIYRLADIKEGEEYEIILTTGGGFYRYATGDIVRVTGRLRGIGLLRFVGRAKTVDLAGEKMSEGFVDRLLADRPGFFLLAPSGDGYTLYTDRPIDRRRVEEMLSENFHYRLARRLGQLRPVRVWLIRGDAREQYLKNCLRNGQKLGDIKPTRLSGRDDFQFEGDFYD